MKQKLAFLLLILIIPFFAFAHGEEVLIPFFIQCGSLFFFFIFMIFIKLRGFYKLILAVTYCVALAFIIGLTWNMPYNQNRSLIDLLISLGPVLITSILFFILRHLKNIESVNDRS